MNQSVANGRERSVFRAGLRAGIPIGLGYFAVAFSLGITARNAGLSAFQCFLMSILCNASAGEYAGVLVIAQQAGYWEMALVTLITNARYLLMGTALSQRMDPKTSMLHRVLLPMTITDELFAIAIARPGYIRPSYSYAAFLVASPCWGLGTAIGCIAGNVLPARIVSALSVALFGMFLAVIIPPARKSRVIAGLIAVSFACSLAAELLLSTISSGTRTILLTVVISAVAALLFPHTPDEEAAA